MEKLNTKRISKALGWTFAAIHATTVLALQTNIINYWQWAHMTDMQITVQPFNTVTFIVGTAVAGVVGAVVGWVFTTLYNKVK